MVVAVEERPAIARSDFQRPEGIRERSTDQGVERYRRGRNPYFRQSLIDAPNRKLKREYLSKGLYGVEITTTVTPIERNRVNITFAVDEGEAAHIKQINFVGKKAFRIPELLKNHQALDSGLIVLVFEGRPVSKRKLSGDIETLKSFYGSRLSGNADRIDAGVDHDRQEGHLHHDQYYPKARNIRFPASSWPAKCSDAKRIEVVEKEGEVYKGQKLTDSTKKIRPHGQFRLCVCQCQRQSGNRQGQEGGRIHRVDRSGQRVYVQHIIIAAIPRHATK